MCQKNWKRTNGKKNANPHQGQSLPSYLKNQLGGEARKAEKKSREKVRGKASWVMTKKDNSKRTTGTETEQKRIFYLQLSQEGKKKKIGKGGKTGLSHLST